MLPIKSSTVRPLSGVVVTFLNTSPAVCPLAGVPAWPNSAVAPRQTMNRPAIAGVNRFEQNFIFLSLPKRGRRTYRTNDGSFTQPCYRRKVWKRSIRVQAGLLQKLPKLAKALIAFGSRCEGPIRANHNVRGKRTDLIRPRHFVFRCQDDRKFVRMFAQELLHYLAFLAHGDADDHEIFFLVAAIELI